MIAGLAEIIREMVAGERSHGLRLTVGAALGLALAYTPAGSDDQARLVLSRRGRRPSAEEEATVLLGLLRALERDGRAAARPLTVQRDVELAGGQRGTIIRWHVPLRYDGRDGVVESQVLTGQVPLFPLPGPAPAAAYRRELG